MIVMLRITRSLSPFSVLCAISVLSALYLSLSLGVLSRGVDPGGDEGDASPPAIGVGGMDNTIIPPGFTNDFNYYYYYSNIKVSLLTLSFYVS